MKIRNDFVTNSSSSSFIISFKEVSLDKELKEQSPIIGLMENIVKKYFMSGTDSYRDNEAQMFRDTDSEGDLKYWLKERYGWYNETFEEMCARENSAKEIYGKVMAELSAGNKVAIKNVPYDDEDLSDLLYILDSENKIKIIKVEEC